MSAAAAAAASTPQPPYTHVLPLTPTPTHMHATHSSVGGHPHSAVSVNNPSHQDFSLQYTPDHAHPQHASTPYMAGSPYTTSTNPNSGFTAATGVMETAHAHARGSEAGRGGGRSGIAGREHRGWGSGSEWDLVGGGATPNSGYVDAGFGSSSNAGGSSYAVHAVVPATAQHAGQQQHSSPHKQQQQQQILQQYYSPHKQQQQQQQQLSENAQAAVKRLRAERGSANGDGHAMGVYWLCVYVCVCECVCVSVCVCVCVCSRIT